MLNSHWIPSVQRLTTEKQSKGQIKNHFRKNTRKNCSKSKEGVGGGRGITSLEIINPKRISAWFYGQSFPVNHSVQKSSIPIAHWEILKCFTKKQMTEYRSPGFSVNECLSQSRPRVGLWSTSVDSLQTQSHPVIHTEPNWWPEQTWDLGVGHLTCSTLVPSRSCFVFLELKVQAFGIPRS